MARLLPLLRQLPRQQEVADVAQEGVDHDHESTPRTDPEPTSTTSRNPRQEVTSKMHPQHDPVLVERCIELLAPALESVEEPVLIDATLGLGGHAHEFLRRFPQLQLIGIDQDAHALDIARQRLAEYADRVVFLNVRNDEFARAVAAAGTRAIAGVIFDLGVSSMQLDFPERGFAYSQDAPLDMRMDPRSPLTAADILNTWDAREIAAILRDYSGEKFAGRIAREVVRRRAVSPWTTSAELVELLYDVIPAPARRTGGHPAKRTFQALRIAVNDELGALKRALPAALDAVVVGGRIVVMSYQSGEDIITKAEFARRTTSTLPSDLPIPAAQVTTSYRLVTRGAETATPAEVGRNPRAASVRLRAIERVAA